MQYNTILYSSLFYPPLFGAADGVGNSIVLVVMLHKQEIKFNIKMWMICINCSITLKILC